MNSTEPLSGWERLEPIGSGGNGEVWKARRNGIECALKVLKNATVDEECYQRFRDEIQVLRELKDDPGVLPILDAHLPEQPTRKNRAWLSMPLATPIKKALGKRPRIDTVVEAIADIAETLTRLAENGICHRDIKPENLYHYRDRYVIGDFGLADFPEKDDVTEEGRALGPRFYIAPEMVRDPVKASGFPADVWSLAKTLWVLATGQNFPPPHPQAASDPKDALAVLVNHPRVFHLDNLIERATNKEPEERPTIQAFAEELRAWLMLSETSIPASDVSDVVSQIKLYSTPLFQMQSQMNRSHEEAKALVKRLMADLNGVSEQLRESGLPCNPPSDNGNNLLTGNTLGRSPQGGYGVTVSMYTPSPTTHIFECGILIQVLEDGRHQLYAAHRIRPHVGQIEEIWSEIHEADFGSCQEQLLLNQLVDGLYSNLRRALERFIEVMKQNTQRGKDSRPS